MTLGPDIRIANPDEIKIVRAMMLAAFAETADSPYPSSALSESVEDVMLAANTGGAVLVEQDGLPLGSGRFTIHEADADGTGKYLSFERLAVLPAVRGRGIGTRLVRWMEEHARSLGFSEVRTTARSMCPDMRPYYEHLGYEITGYSGRYGLDRIRTHMRKTLHA